MRKNIVLAVLGIAGIGTAVLILIGLAVSDGNPPKIVFSQDTISYKDGEDPSILLDIVSAKDQEDGDVSDSLIVKNLYQVSDKYGIVVFAAKDSSNNVVVESHGFVYEDGAASETPKPTEEVEEEETDVPQEEDTPENEGNPPETETPTEEQPISEAVDYSKIRKENLANGTPFLELLQYEVTLSKNADFIVQKYVKEAVDNKDDAIRHLHLENKPDMKTPGTYEVSVYIRDADGNKSNVEKLKVTVK
ncbi:MAG: hypothetical protein RSD28_01980 [Lachnospiraceae bacterium]